MERRLPFAREEPKRSRKRQVLRVVKITVLALVFAIALFSQWFFAHYEIRVTIPPRMRPTMPVGSWNIAEKVDENTVYEVGDIIHYYGYMCGKYYTEVPSRIIAIEGDRLYCKGDNNETRDVFIVTRDNVLSKYKYVNVFSCLAEDPFQK